MKSLNSWKYLFVINFCKYCKILTYWFNVLKNDWRVAILLVCSAIFILSRNLLNISNSYFLTADDLLKHEQIDISSSIVSMEPLLNIEQILVQALNEHANVLQEHINEIRRGISTMRKQREIYEIDAEEFLSTPVNSFPMLRRLKHEWKAWLKFLKEPIPNDFVNLIGETLKNVEDFDLTPSAESVQSLCDLYNIEPKYWIKGRLNVNMSFTTLDCYAIAFLLHKRDRFDAANKWFEAALASYKPKSIYDYVIDFNRMDIYETYVENLLKQNRSFDAFEVISNAMEAGFTDLELSELLSQVELFMANTNKSGAELLKEKPNDKIKNGCHTFDVNPSPSLYCSYNWNTNNNFVRLAPFKFELLSDDPLVILYREVFDADELRDLKNLAMHAYKRQTTFSTSIAATESSKLDTLFKSENVPFDEQQHSDLSMVINKRLEDMTGLNTFGSNILIGHYEIGDYSIAHTDCLETCSDHSEGGDCDARLATISIFLTDTTAGGGIIFPELDVSVSPPKSAAIFWYNLHDNMSSCDSRTLHMSCPVISGTKWYITKWINLKNQIFRKPCLA